MKVMLLVMVVMRSLRLRDRRDGVVYLHLESSFNNADRLFHIVCSLKRL